MRIEFAQRVRAFAILIYMLIAILLMAIGWVFLRLTYVNERGSPLYELQRDLVDAPNLLRELGVVIVTGEDDGI